MVKAREAYVNKSVLSFGAIRESFLEAETWRLD